MKTAVLARLKRLETVRAVQESDRQLKIEFAYLKLLPREYSGPRHIVTLGRRPDGREECEERPGEAPPNHVTARNENVMKVYFVRASGTSDETRGATD